MYLISAWTSCWTDNRYAGDFRRHDAHVTSLYCRTVRCRYKAVNFLRCPHKIRPIARPLGRGMGCILWVQTVIYTPPQSLQWCMQYRVILDRVITAPDWIFQASHARRTSTNVWATPVKTEPHVTITLVTTHVDVFLGTLASNARLTSTSVPRILAKTTPNAWTSWIRIAVTAPLGSREPCVRRISTNVRQPHVEIMEFVWIVSEHTFVSA